MPRSKYTTQTCRYCNKTTKMGLVGEMQGAEDKVWYRCTRCHHMALIDLKAQAADQQQSKLDRTSATVYSPELTFKIGESIFHNEWDDLGRVMSKTRTSDGSEAILVAFEKLGQRRLIENFKLEESAQLSNVH